MSLLGRLVRSIMGQATLPRDESAGSPSSLDAAYEALAAGRLPEALAAAREAVARGAPDASARYLGAAALMQWGRARDALAWFREATEAGGDSPAIALGHGAAALAAGHAEEAERVLSAAFDRTPASAELAAALARARAALGRVDDAIRVCESVLAAGGASAPLLSALAHAELAAGRADRAEQRLREALALDGGSGNLWFELARLCGAQDRYDEALEAVERVRRSRDAAAMEMESFAATAYLMRMRGDLEGAVAWLRSGLAACPHADSHHLYGEALLTLGQYRAGWRQFEFRWMHEALVGKRVAYGRPEWSGQDLRGRTVLVHSEQGIGDVVMFARYLPMLKRLGARVLFLPRIDMDRVARRFPGVDAVLGDGDRLPPFDYTTYLMALPRVFGTTLETIPAEVPYLGADEARSHTWRERLAGEGGPKVGLVWGGRPTQSRNHLRSIPLAAMLPVLRVPGLRFYSLQKGPAEAELERLPADVRVVALGGHFDDVEDLVAAMGEMDLVISVCTGPAHIAGAMGKPVWTMISEPPDLRWLTVREDSPWYPTMRLFRQSTPGRWGNVIERVADELARGPAAWRPPPVPRGRPARVSDPAPDPAPVQSGDLDAGLAQLAETRQGVVMYDPDEADVGPSIARYGEWLHAQLELALRFVAPGAVAVEAGAGVGVHAVAIGRALGADGRLLVYEDRLARRRMLRQNLAANGIANAVTMTRTLGGPRRAGFDAAHETVDDLGLERLDLLKTGASTDAAAIVEGAQQTLWRCRPRLLLAVQDDDSLARLGVRVREFGYRVWRSETPLYSPSNFNRRDDDAFGGRSALALVALPEEIDLREAPPGCVESD